MSELFALTEFHDARMSSLLVRIDGVVVSFDRFVCYQKTNQAEVFDVRTHELELVFAGATRIDVSELMANERTIVDGALFMEGREFPIRGNGTVEGACRCELTFSTGAKIRIDANRVELRFGVGRLLEKWLGPL